MKQSGVALTLGLALLALGACAPLQRGGRADLPIEQPTSLSETTVLPGQTVYASYTYPRAAFEDDGEFAGRFDAIALDYAGARRNDDQVPDASALAPWFTLKTVEAPSGVSVALLRASIGRVVTQTRVSGASVSVRYREEFRLLYRVSVARGFRWTPAPGVGGKGPENPYAALTFSDGRRNIGARMYLRFSPEAPATP